VRRIFKRLILSPHVFESYAHFDKNGNGDNWDDVMDVDQATMDYYTTTDLVREDGNDKVYRLYAAEGSDTGSKYWLNMTAASFTAVFDADAIIPLMVLTQQDIQPVQMFLTQAQHSHSR